MHPRLITYFTWLSEELITVPNFPAWICDMCGKRDYDEKAVPGYMLLNPTGKPIPEKLVSLKPRRAPGTFKHRSLTKVPMTMDVSPARIGSSRPIRLSYRAGENHGDQYRRWPC
jgi:YgiT-type zinc finger domain-containing protein